MIDRIKSVVQDSIIIPSIESTTPLNNSVLISSPLNTNEVHSANTALLSELAAGGVLSTRNYAKKIVKRSERAQVRNIIVEEEQSKLKAAMTKRKTILSGKRKIIDGKHILTTAEIFMEAEKNAKKGR